MEVSMKEFLETGRLGQSWLGLTREQIIELLGVPDAVGGVSRNYRRPSIYKYADLEFHFNQLRPSVCVSMYIEASEDAKFRLPKMLDVSDWTLTPESSQSDVIRYLDEIHVDYSIHSNPTNTTSALQLDKSGVEIMLDESAKLNSLSLSYDNVSLMQE